LFCNITLKTKATLIKSMNVEDIIRKKMIRSKKSAMVIFNFVYRSGIAKKIVNLIIRTGMIGKSVCTIKLT